MDRNLRTGNNKYLPFIHWPSHRKGRARVIFRPDIWTLECMRPLADLTLCIVLVGFFYLVLCFRWHMFRPIEMGTRSRQRWTRRMLTLRIVIQSFEIILTILTMWSLESSGDYAVALWTKNENSLSEFRCIGTPIVGLMCEVSRYLVWQTRFFYWSDLFLIIASFPSTKFHISWSDFWENKE